MFNVIAGRLKPTSGRVFMAGEEITGLPPHELFHKGLLRTFQIAHEFSSMTVRENLMMVPGAQHGESLWNALFRRRQMQEDEIALQKKADEVLDFLTISHLRDEKAGNLSGGQKKLLELGRTMMVEARIVFLDEVGAEPHAAQHHKRRHRAAEPGTRLYLLRHRARHGFHRPPVRPGHRQAEGKVLARGSADEIRQNEAVIGA